MFAVDCDPRRGLVCLNIQQDFGTTCADYKVRFLCPEGTIENTKGTSCQEYCVSEWFNRDNPDKTCDCERLADNLATANLNPSGINCVEAGTEIDYQDLAQRMTCNQRVRLI